MMSSIPIAKLKLWQIDAAGATTCALLGLLWYMAGLQPLQDACAAREALQTQVQERTTQLEDATTKREHFEKLVAATQNQIDHARVKLLEVEHLNTRVGELNKLAKDQNLRVDEIKPGLAAALPHYTTVPIRIAGAGTFGACVSFLRELRAKYPDTGVSAFEIKGEPESPDKTPTFGFSLVWYATPPAQTAPSAKK